MADKEDTMRNQESSGGTSMGRKNEDSCDALAAKVGVLTGVFGTAAFYAMQEYGVSSMVSQIGKIRYLFPVVGGVFVGSLVGMDRRNTCINQREAHEDWVEYNRSHFGGRFGRS